MKHRFLSLVLAVLLAAAAPYANAQEDPPFAAVRDRKSTRLNSSHM